MMGKRMATCDRLRPDMKKYGSTKGEKKMGQGRFLFAEPQYCCVYLTPFCIMLICYQLHLRGCRLLHGNTVDRKH